MNLDNPESIFKGSDHAHSRARGRHGGLASFNVASLIPYDKKPLAYV